MTVLKVTIRSRSFSSQVLDDNYRQRCACFQGKKPPSRQHKKEYCDSCFYRDQPETPAGPNDEKIALTASVSGKNTFLNPAT